MRGSNLVISVTGVVAVMVALAVVIRWYHLPTIAPHGDPDPSDRRRVAGDALRTVGVISTAGLIAGLVGVGVIGRFVMRIVAATSGAAAQGRVTEAGEVVGRITNEGTVGFVIFMGLVGGLALTTAFLILRRWLPTTTGRAGLVIGIVLLGTAGVGDPLSPDNIDFRILTPTWLAVTLIAATAMLTATMFTALVVRLDVLSLAGGWERYAAYVGLVMVALPSPLLPIAVVYIAARTLWPGRLHGWLESPRVERVGVIGVWLIVAATTLTTLNAAASILRA